MIENCTLYFPTKKLRLEKLLPGGTSDGGLFRKATWYEYQVGDGRIRLNLGHPDLERHLQGFKAYVSRLPGDAASRARARSLINGVATVVGVKLPGPVATGSEAFGSLMYLIEQLDGFMFVADSVLLPDGTFLVGPNADPAEDEPELVPEPLREVHPSEFRHEGKTEGADPDRLAMRERHYCLLAERGFRCSRWLPLYRMEEEKDSLRPLSEIGGRLLALNALFLWASTPEDVAATDQLQKFVAANQLSIHLTEEEGQILAQDRAEAQNEHRDAIGWRLENMWPLAWILGFEPPHTFSRASCPKRSRAAWFSSFCPISTEESTP